MITAGYHYSVFRCDRKDRIGGGCMILAHNSLRVRAISFPQYINFNDVQQISIEVYSAGQVHVISCIYNPPGLIHDCLKTLTDIINYICSRYHLVVLFGDFNIPGFAEKLNADVKIDNKCSQIADKIIEFGLNQIIEEPTRGKNMLDLVFCTNFVSFDNVMVLPPFSNSDHCALSVNVCVNSAYDYNGIEKVFDFKNCDFEHFSMYLRNINWSELLLYDESIDIDSVWDRFMCVLRHYVNQFVPKFCKQQETKTSKTVKYPSYLLRLQENKRKFWRTRHCPGGLNMYLNASKLYTKAVKRFHKNREMKLLKLGQNGFYKYINKRLKSRSVIPPMSDETGTMYVKDIEKANGFMHVFKEVFTVDNGMLPNFPHKNVVCEDFVDLSPKNVSKYLRLANKLSAAGPDGFPGVFWTNLSTSLSVPLSIIFNQSYNTGHLPAVWKLSYVSPIHKKGDKSNFKNYRPVALTCIPCRVMEAIVRDCMMLHVTNNNMLSEHQHGFLKGHSTGLQILECLDEWTQANESGKCVDICYVDFCRAFDTVSIPKLLHKLNAYGFQGRLLTWLAAFLVDRKLCVKIGNSLSDCVTQTSGIAQGTCLGPTCFTLYINDLPSVVKFCKCKLFADDAKFSRAFFQDECTDCIQDDLNSIVLWADTWQLTISIEKTVMLHLGIHNPKRIYTVNNCPVQSKDVVKDLGIAMCSDLSFSTHCMDVVRKAMYIANAILHSFLCKDVSVYMKAFDAYVRPILEYCCFVWNPTLCRDIDMIEKVQKTFTRRVFWKCNLPILSYVERLKFLKRDTLEHRRLVLSLCMFKKIFHGFVHCDILKKFQVPSRQLRSHKYKLFVPFCKSKVRYNFFSLKMLRVWNNLPENIVSSNVMTAFKHRISQIDLSCYLRWN